MRRKAPPLEFLEAFVAAARTGSFLAAAEHQQWGEPQADHHLDDLDEGIQRLASNPELGASRDHVRQGYRILFVKRHAIYYRATATAIRIIRVMHVRMDADGHL